MRLQTFQKLLFGTNLTIKCNSKSITYIFLLYLCLFIFIWRALCNRSTIRYLKERLDFSALVLRMELFFKLPHQFSFSDISYLFRVMVLYTLPVIYFSVQYFTQTFTNCSLESYLEKSKRNIKLQNFTQEIYYF